MGLWALRRWRPVVVPAQLPSWAPRALWGLALAVLLVNVNIGYRHIAHTRRTGEVRLDQGQNTHRAALALLRGENPYGRGALLDPEAYGARLGQRTQAGVGPLASVGDLEVALARYWESQDPALRAALLPSGAAVTPEAAREVSLLGYKYGPVLFLAAAPLAGWLGPTALPVLNLLCFLAWALLVARLAADDIGHPGVAPLTLAAAFADRHLAWNFLFNWASDIWVLLFAAASLLAFQRRWWSALGVSLGLALGCKLFPAVLFLALLLAARSGRAAVAFALTACALYLPFAAWDWRGFVNNLVLWPTLMAPDTTSWVAYSPPAVAWAIRAGLLLLSGGVLLGVARRGGPLLWSFAVASLCVVAAGSVIHNNYLPWFSTWALLALGQRCAGGVGR